MRGEKEASRTLRSPAEHLPGEMRRQGVAGWGLGEQSLVSDTFRNAYASSKWRCGINRQLNKQLMRQLNIQVRTGERLEIG